MTFQGLILKLSEFWASRGCALQQPLDVEVGAGTMHPETFLRVLGPAHWSVAYVQPSRRPADGRFGENPNRLFKHHQFQVVLKPAPDDVQQMYLESLEACGQDTHGALIAALPMPAPSAPGDVHAITHAGEQSGRMIVLANTRGRWQRLGVVEPRRG